MLQNILLFKYIAVVQVVLSGFVDVYRHSVQSVGIRITAAIAELVNHFDEIIGVQTPQILRLLLSFYLTQRSLLSGSQDPHFTATVAISCECCIFAPSLCLTLFYRAKRIPLYILYTIILILRINLSRFILSALGLLPPSASKCRHVQLYVQNRAMQ